MEPHAWVPELFRCGLAGGEAEEGVRIEQQARASRCSFSVAHAVTRTGPRPSGDVHGTRGSHRPEYAARNTRPKGTVIAFGAVHDAISRRTPRAPTARLYSIGPSLDWAAGVSHPVSGACLIGRMGAQPWERGTRLVYLGVVELPFIRGPSP